MMRYMLMFVLMLVLTTSLSAEEPVVAEKPTVAVKSKGSLPSWIANVPRLPSGENLFEHIKKNAVTLEGVEHSFVSGTVLERGSRERGFFKIILTCSHLTDGRHEREVIDESGKKKTIVEFDLVVISVRGADGKLHLFPGRIIHYSHYKYLDDICLILPENDDHLSTCVGDVLFPTEVEAAHLLELGETVFHCGSFYGARSAQSVSFSMASNFRVPFDGKYFDQLDRGATPGSSGGLFYRADGKPVGMIVIGSKTETLFWMTPIARMWEWAKRNHLEWVLDSSRPAPSREELLTAVPIEDLGRSSSPNGMPSVDFSSFGQGGDYHYMIYHPNAKAIPTPPAPTK